MDIADFISTISQTGLQRNNKYYVNLTPPPQISVSNDDLLALRTLAYNVSAPNFNFGTFEFSRLGTPHRMPNTEIFGELIVSYRVQGDGRQIQIFDQWRDLIFDPESKVFNFLSEYAGSCSVSMLNENGGVVHTKEYGVVYPKLVAPTNLNFEEFDALLTYDVTFYYQTVRNV